MRPTEGPTVEVEEVTPDVVVSPLKVEDILKEEELPPGIEGEMMIRKVEITRRRKVIMTIRTVAHLRGEWEEVTVDAEVVAVASLPAEEVAEVDLEEDHVPSPGGERGTMMIKMKVMTEEIEGKAVEEVPEGVTDLEEEEEVTEEVDPDLHWFPPKLNIARCLHHLIS